MTALLAFTVLGNPAPAGSKRGFQRGERIIITDDNPRAKPWQHCVRAAVAEQLPAGFELLTEPLAVTMRFYRTRPRGHYGTGRNSYRLRTTAPTAPATRPDVLKLARAVEDALTGLVWRDDAQIVAERLTKDYGDPARVEIRVSTETPDILAAVMEARA